MLFSSPRSVDDVDRDAAFAWRFYHLKPGEGMDYVASLASSLKRLVTPFILLLSVRASYVPSHKSRILLSVAYLRTAVELRDTDCSSKMMVARQSQPDMEVVPAELEVMPVDGLNVYYNNSNEKYIVISDTEESAPEPVHQDEEPRSPIWRREKKTFWLSVALSILVVIVIIVATVAGIEGSKNRTKPKGKQHTSFRRSALLEIFTDN